MEKFLIDHWQILSFLVVLIFNGGIIYKSMKDKPNEKEVQKMIDEKFENHCPFADRMATVEKVQKEDAQAVEHIKRKIDQIGWNVQNICENMNIPFIGKKNGSS